MCGFFFSFFACTPHSCSNAAESERCGIAFVEVLQHSYSEPGVYNLLASHRMILEGHFHTVFSPLSLSNIQATSMSAQLTLAAMVKVCSKMQEMHKLFFSHC